MGISWGLSGGISGGPFPGLGTGSGEGGGTPAGSLGGVSGGSGGRYGSGLGLSGTGTGLLGSGLLMVGLSGFSSTTAMRPLCSKTGREGIPSRSHRVESARKDDHPPLQARDYRYQINATAGAIEIPYFLGGLAFRISSSNSAGASSPEMALCSATVAAAR